MSSLPSAKLPVNISTLKWLEKMLVLPQTDVPNFTPEEIKAIETGKNRLL